MVSLSDAAICASAALVEGGKGVRFEVAAANGERVPAFAVRYAGVAYAFLNRCAHLAVQLDWTEGDFFSVDGHSLVCATHGARYHPASGACIGGRCQGKPLTALPVLERDGAVLLAPGLYALMTESITSSP